MKIPRFVFVALVLLLVGSSCKKNTDNPVQDALVGKWKNTFAVADANGNHIKDAHDAVDTINNQYTIEYYPDGTGAVLFSNTTTSAGSFSWQLLDNNAYLKTIVPGASTTIQHIDSLTATRMVLKDTTGISYEWQIFAKQ